MNKLILIAFLCLSTFLYGQFENCNINAKGRSVCVYTPDEFNASIPIEIVDGRKLSYEVTFRKRQNKPKRIYVETTDFVDVFRVKDFYVKVYDQQSFYTYTGNENYKGECSADVFVTLRNKKVIGFIFHINDSDDFLCSNCQKAEIVAMEVVGFEIYYLNKKYLRNFVYSLETIDGTEYVWQNLVSEDRNRK